MRHVRAPKVLPKVLKLEGTWGKREGRIRRRTRNSRRECTRPHAKARRLFAEETADVVAGIRDTRVANCINGGSACAAWKHEGRVGRDVVAPSARSTSGRLINGSTRG